MKDDPDLAIVLRQLPFELKLKIELMTLSCDSSSGSSKLQF